ncbi:hypothetical protein K458DRAFT_418219 [Lentithecium fluviatile CBS 122367]|uniref:Uncharacterized protein n=1 Tax=Lentithecium fluviatile CBS 122367 TaxID=1168545 RepID=A0A6G1J0U7_9PLEO|nr:hypothetical protein K458DRAFT_418219 [Lentithecium fluviatile CBS 122367]
MAAGCAKVLEVSDQCREMSILPVGPLPTTSTYPTGTTTTTNPTITRPANGTQSCGRGMPKCPTGYQCREKDPERVADYMFCFIETTYGSPSSNSTNAIGTPTPTPIITTPVVIPLGTGGGVCGGFAGVECPAGFVCEFEDTPDGTAVSDAQGICKADTITTK